MTSLRGKKAVILGATSGVGRATVGALAGEGAVISAVARGADALSQLRREIAGLETHEANAADPSTAGRLLREIRPSSVVLTAGVRPHMAPLHEQTWETFSEAWQSDTQAAFHLVKSALTLPLAPGSTVVIVSSGAAIQGSPLSGGYAGAKRMQWLIARYAQQVANKEGLGIRFIAVVPHQLIAGTEIGEGAAKAYGAAQGISAAEFMTRFTQPLDAAGVAAAIMGCLRGDMAPGVTAIRVTGEGVEPLD